MLTIFGLCIKMGNSGRPITARTLRDWWTRGLLPQPQRKWLGRGFGSETFWARGSVLLQAETAYDCFHRPGRRVSADDVTVQLWLRGFKISGETLRNALIKKLNRHEQNVGANDDEREEFVAKLAPVVAQNFVRANGTARLDKAAVDAVTDVYLLLINTFYGIVENNVVYQLEELWALAGPWLGNLTNKDGKRKAMPLKDVLMLLPFFDENATIPAQRTSITLATEYEFLTAQRILQLVMVLFRRLYSLSADADLAGMTAFCEPLTFKLAPMVLPVFIGIVRNGDIKAMVISIVLDGLRRSRAKDFFVEFQAFNEAGRIP